MVSDISLKIQELREKLAKTPVNKATERERARLKARIARLEHRLEKKPHRHSFSYGVKKQGQATVILVGPPSSGKSTLLNLLTNAKSKVGAYEFTTIKVVPGMMKYNGAEIQILDIPGLIEGSSKGRGFGRKVLSVARNADLILLITDVERIGMLDVIKKELYESGFRLNRKKPEIKISRKNQGGLKIKFLQEIDGNADEFKEIAREFGLVNAEIIISQKINSEEFLDFLAGNRVYIPALEVINKADLNDKVRAKGLLISAKTGKNIGFLKERIWEKLGIMRVYLKKTRKRPDIEKPLIVKKGSSASEICKKIHYELYEKFKYAKVWGKSAKFPGQKIGADHILEDGDIIEIHSK